MWKYVKFFIFAGLFTFFVSKVVTSVMRLRQGRCD